MGRVILCMGQKAQTPYCFEKLGIRVWTVEELCFCLKENAFLLDEEIVSNVLVRWLEEQCELTELAGILQPMVRHQSSPAAFVIKILEYTGLYETQVMTEVSRTLQSGASLSDYEKEKTRRFSGSESEICQSAYGI